ncbi:MAG: aspartate aminotransferase family protein [Patescibacteria group bacterium]
MKRKYSKYIFGSSPFRRPVIASAKGNYYIDYDGNKFLDLMSGQFATVLGHADPIFIKEIHKQLKKVVHTSTLHLSFEVLEAAKAVASLTNGTLKKVLLLSTGAEAVECAIRNAKFYTGKDHIVSISAGYHGLTLATQSLSSSGQYAMPKVPGSLSIPTPDWIHSDTSKSEAKYISECLKKSEILLRKYRGKIAAFIYEPIISVGGMIYPPRQYFLGLKRLAKKHEALLIADECQTGLGRTGTWFGFQRTHVVPDILVLAKNAGLGLPVSAVIFDTKIAATVESKLIHFSSHQNDPIAAKALSILIHEIRRRKLLPYIRSIGKYFVDRLKKLAITEPLLILPRGKGLMLGFDLPDYLFSKGRNAGQQLMLALEDRGINIQCIRKGKTFRILPAYTLKRHEIDFFIDALRTSLHDLQTK